MYIIDCMKIRDRILKNIYPENFRGRSLLAIVKEDNAANGSYLKSIQRMATKFGLPMDVCYPDPACFMDDIRRYLEVRPSGTCVLLVGFDDSEAKSIPTRFKRFTAGKRFLDNTARPDVVIAVMEVLSELDMLNNPPRRTAIIGRSRNAKSLNNALVMRNHTTTIVHTRTEDMESVLREADLIVSFAGSPNLIKSSMVKYGATVISVGCGTLDGKLCGDIDVESFGNRSVTITPTPGGIGPICTAVLFRDIAKGGGK